MIWWSCCAQIMIVLLPKFSTAFRALWRRNKLEFLCVFLFLLACVRTRSALASALFCCKYDAFRTPEQVVAITLPRIQCCVMENMEFVAIWIKLALASASHHFPAFVPRRNSLIPCSIDQNVCAPALAYLRILLAYNWLPSHVDIHFHFTLFPLYTAISTDAIDVPQGGNFILPFGILFTLLYSPSFRLGKVSFLGKWLSKKKEGRERRRKF